MPGLRPTESSNRIFRMPESSFSYRRSGIRDTFKDLNILFDIALQPSLFYLYLCILEI